MALPAQQSVEKLISEALRPVFTEGDEGRVVVGEPILPGAFVWRGTTYPVLRVESAGRGMGPCTHGSGERYVRRHWYRLETTGGLVMQVYFERRPRGKQRQRWWLYAITDPPDASGKRGAHAPG